MGVIVAIPARDESRMVGSCLAALARQRDQDGAPLATAFEVILLANNCTDDTAERARSFEAALPFRLHVAEVRLPEMSAHAGGARRAVMDLAAERLERAGDLDGIILTTDADSRTCPTWIDAQFRAIAAGADAVAGYVDADPDDYIALGPAFGQRGRDEDRYLRAIAEINALCDPRPHDPWPNHRVASGASLGVTLTAYRAAGGMPSIPLGEDRAFVHSLECAGFRVRHSMEACVTTSCRFDGRAKGGAADTMRARHLDPEAACDDDMVPAVDVLRVAALKGRMRRFHTAGVLADTGRWAPRLRLTGDRSLTLVRRFAEQPFARLWQALLSESSVPAPRASLRPKELPCEIGKAARILASLRRSIAVSAQGPRADRQAPAAKGEPASSDPSQR